MHAGPDCGGIASHSPGVGAHLVGNGEQTASEGMCLELGCGRIPHVAGKAHEISPNEEKGGSQQKDNACIYLETKSKYTVLHFLQCSLLYFLKIKKQITYL